MPDERGWGVKRGKSLRGARNSAGRSWMGCEAWKTAWRYVGESPAGRSETGVPEERGWDVQRGNSLGASWKERDGSFGRAWMGYDGV